MYQASTRRHSNHTKLINIWLQFWLQFWLQLKDTNALQAHEKASTMRIASDTHSIASDTATGTKRPEAKDDLSANCVLRCIASCVVDVVVDKMPQT